MHFSKSGCDLKEESRKNKQTFGFSPVFRINSICLQVPKAFQPFQLFATFQRFIEGLKNTLNYFVNISNVVHPGQSNTYHSDQNYCWL